MSDPTNAQQIEFWNGATGEAWVDGQVQLDELLSPISQVLLARAAAGTGQRVLDVGCGAGASTIALAEAGAQVLGVDVSAPLLARARARAEGLDNCEFLQADAARAQFDAPFDLLVSRFGVMFFDDPLAAFTQLRKALAADGRLVFVCWQAPASNEWLSVPGRAVGSVLGPPPAADDPHAPGPFAFADADHLRGVLEGAGFRDVGIEAQTSTLHIGGSVDDAVALLSRVGPLSRALAEADETRRGAAIDAARSALEARLEALGIRLASAYWLVTARR